MLHRLEAHLTSLLVRDEDSVLASLEHGVSLGGDLEPVYELHLAVRRVQAQAKAAMARSDGKARLPAAPVACPLDFDDLSVEASLLAEAAQRIAAVIGAASTATAENRDLTADRCLDEARAWYVSRLPPAMATSPIGVAVAHALVPWLEAAGQRNGLFMPEQRRPTCPVCGGYPDLAVLAPDRGERRLICSRCSTDWAYRRLGCPFCREGEREAATFHEGFAPGDRLYVCDSCHGYIKTLDLRQHGVPMIVQSERVRLLPLDVVAGREGYRPGFAAAQDG